MDISYAFDQNPIRVVLAIPKLTGTSRIRNILSRSLDISIVREASNGLEAIELVNESETDVLIIDMESPIMAGWEVLHRLRVDNSPIRMIGFSVRADTTYIEMAFSAGACAYLTNDDTPEQMIETILYSTERKFGTSDSRSLPATYQPSVQPHIQGTNPTKPRGKGHNSKTSRSSQNPITVVLADDHIVVRIGLRNLISRTSDIHVIGEASNGLEAIDLVDELSPDVLLLDVEMPVMDGVEVARRLWEAKSPVRILALSPYKDKQYLLSLLDYGVAGYLTKDELPENIIEAIRGIMN